ncbi:MAG TPA: hypothetical protein VI757_01950 [Bacteroidia bacterium]|nr:hypothetical protein [Bacteroidia bacterium]
MQTRTILFSFLFLSLTSVAQLRSDTLVYDGTNFFHKKRQLDYGMTGQLIRATEYTLAKTEWKQAMRNRYWQNVLLWSGIVAPAVYVIGTSITDENPFWLGNISLAAISVTTIIILDSPKRKHIRKAVDAYNAKQ